MKGKHSKKRWQPPGADTIRWHGVIGHDKRSYGLDTIGGMTISELRSFLELVDAEIAETSKSCSVISDAVPLVATYRNGALRNIWAPICKRKEEILSHEA